MLSKKIAGGLRLLVLTSLLFGCTKRASDEIDFGTMTDSVYHNKYFGFSLTLPKTWSVQDQKTQQKLMKQGAEVVAGNDKNLKAAVKASELQSVNLLAAFQHPVGSPVPYNPSIISVAEMTRQLPGITRGKDYLYQARQMLEAGQIKVNFGKDVYAARVGGTEFDVMELEMSAMGKSIKQKYFAAIQKGYALCFVLSFTTDKEAASLQEILDTVKFD